MRGDLPGMDGFVTNAWYVAGLSEDFDTGPVPVTLLGEQVVVFRGSDGRPNVLEDACPHRKLPLSKGKIDGDVIVCGYHGLTFDGSGACVLAPTQLDTPPRRCMVRSYPARDRYGFLWVWMGQGAPGAILEVPNFDSTTWAVTPRGAMSMAAHYLYVIDNLLDPSHVAWVHVGSFAGAGTDTGPLELEETDDSVTVFRWISGAPAPPYYAEMLPFGPICDRKQHYECRLPSTAINKSVYTPAGEGGADKPLSPNAFVNISYNFITPIDANRSMYFWFQHRNMHVEDTALSERMFAGAKLAFEEDKEVLEHVHTGMAERRSDYINLGLDAGAMRFRSKLEKRIADERGRA